MSDTAKKPAYSLTSRSTAATHPGLKRAHNADALWVDDERGLYAVADGSSEAGGVHAARILLFILHKHAEALAKAARGARAAADPAAARRAVFDQLTEVLQAANADIFGFGKDHPEMPGTTTTATVLLIDGRGVYLAHLGDARAYILRGGNLRQFSQDHTMAAELVRMGRLKPEEVPGFRYRSVVAKVLGERAPCRPDLAYIDLLPGDKLLLCTDGLSDRVDDKALNAAMMSAESATAEALIDLALKAGGGDNVTAVTMGIESAAGTPVKAVETASPTSDSLDLLGKLTFCKHLGRDELLKVHRYLHEVQLSAGQVVFRQGEAGQDLFLLLSGECAVEVDGQALSRVGPGGHFGEIALVSGQPRSATVVARVPTVLMRLTRDDFYDLSQRDQAVAVKMLWNFSQQLATRVTALSHEVAGSRRQSQGEPPPPPAR
jgi:serine/threonine protein phosphatase PrpC